MKQVKIRARAFGPVLGIDPGVAGGIAIITREGIIKLFEMPPSPFHLGQLFKAVAPAGIALAIVEKVHALPNGGNVSSMFKFGKGVGILIGILTALEIPYEEIDPKTWQAALGIKQRAKRLVVGGKVLQDEETRSAWKNRLKAKAVELFPELAGEINLNTADALLMAEMAYRSLYGLRS